MLLVPRERRLHLAIVLAALLAACPGEEPPITPREAGRGEGLRYPDGFRRPDGVLDWRLIEPRPPGEFGFGGCEQLGNRFQLRYMVKGFDLVSTDLKTVSGSAGIIGVTGTSTDGFRFWLGRDGDPNGAAYSEIKVYQAGDPLYHVRLQRWPASSPDCEGSPGCETYYGLGGNLQIATVQAPTQGRFNISLIVTPKGCWVDTPGQPPITTGCSVIGGNFYGCFKVN